MSDWSRHHVLAHLGPAGQQRIARTTILVVGLGGLGSPVARYLAAAGIGRLLLCDFDTVSASDLHRQILFGPYDEGISKAETAAPSLAQTHPDSIIEALSEPFSPEMLAGVDIVVDGTDEPGTRMLVHAACRQAGIPLVWGTVEGWDGQVTTLHPDGPCLDCLFPGGREAHSCAETGVFGPLAGFVGTAMALEAAKVAAGLPTLAGRLWIIDGLESRVESVAYERRSDCPTCAEGAK